MEAAIYLNEWISKQIISQRLTDLRFLQSCIFYRRSDLEVLASVLDHIQIGLTTTTK